MKNIISLNDDLGRLKRLTGFRNEIQVIHPNPCSDKKQAL
jgi:hypothetical protein